MKHLHTSSIIEKTCHIRSIKKVLVLLSLKEVKIHIISSICLQMKMQLKCQDYINIWLYTRS